MITVSRRDLTPGQQAVQSSHAAIDFIFSYPKAALEWHKDSNYFIALTVADEHSLKVLSAKMHFQGITIIEFCEPDLDNALTAIAFFSSERTKKFTDKLLLAHLENS